VASERATEAEAAGLTAELAGLVRAANAGEAGGLDRLREFLNRHPEAAQVAGDLARLAESAWLGLLSASPAVREILGRRVASLKAEVAGPHPSPTEQLLADLAGLNFLIVHRSAVAEADQARSPDRSAAAAKSSESAQRRFVKVLKCLAELRAHLRAGLVAPGTVRVFDPDRKQA
jgi:hypothetical protein